LIDGGSDRTGRRRQSWDRAADGGSAPVPPGACHPRPLRPPGGCM